jgi:hypothetical protein
MVNKDIMSIQVYPWAWRQVRVTFIPKPMKTNYTEAKAYHQLAQPLFLIMDR